LKYFFMRIIKEHHEEGPMRSTKDCVVWPADSTYCLTCGPCWGNQQLTLCVKYSMWIQQSPHQSLLIEIKQSLKSDTSTPQWQGWLPQKTSLYLFIF
jgi:hypothetical protein